MRPVVKIFLAEAAIVGGAGIIITPFVTPLEWASLVIAYCIMQGLNAYMWYQSIKLNNEVHGRVMARYHMFMNYDQGLEFTHMMIDTVRANKSNPLSLIDGYQAYWRQVKLRNLIQQELPF